VTGASKPRVFIGSSSEGSDIAETINLRLSKDCDTKLWDAGVFGLTQAYLESLEQALADFEFAVLVITPDDVRESRGVDSRVPRDNVLFELGLFMGRLGRARTFVACDPKVVSLPSDLAGVSVAEYDSDAYKRDMMAAITPAATKIVHAIRQAPRLAPSSRAKESVRELMDPDALYTSLVSWTIDEGDDIVIQTPETSWAWQLVPSLFYWKLSGASVRVFAPPVQPAQGRAELARRTLLTEFGIEVREAKTVPVNGFFLRKQYADDDVAIVLDGGVERSPDHVDLKAPHAIRYSGRVDGAAVRALLSLLPPAGHGDGEVYTPALQPLEPVSVVELLKKGVSQYRPAKVKLQPTTVRTRKLSLLSSYTRAYKYRQIERLSQLYAEIDCEPFSTAAVKLRSGKLSILTPPVVEMSDDEPVVIEGNTRATFCRETHVNEYHCIAVEGVADSLPGTPVGIDKITISERSLSQDERTSDFQQVRFRPIERATHPY
jgi:hypothetical protein